MEHDFIVMWCNEGLEYVADITADEQRVVVEALRGNASPRHAYANPFHLRLRAQFNTQRHYEIYYIGVEEGVTEQDIKDMFRYDPQGSADLIRSKGTCFYSNRLDPNQRSVIV